MTDISYYDLAGLWLTGRDSTNGCIPAVGDYVVLEIDGDRKPYKVVERLWRNRSLSAELYVREVHDEWALRWARAPR